VDGSLQSFHVQVSLAVGSAFELIVIMYLLARLGIVSPVCMSACRKYAAVFAILAAAFATPEPFSLNTLFVAVGLYLLYEVGIMFANLAARRRIQQSRHDDDGVLALAG
jgi:sec-independent protein translocase protein TatC